MSYYEKKSFLSKLNNPIGYAIIIFVVITIIVAGEHFFPAIRYMIQFCISKIIGVEENYPEVALREEAMWFIFKTIGGCLATLLGTFLLTLILTPIVLFAKVIEELIDARNKLTQTLREYNKVQTDFIEFSDKVAQHNEAQLASMQRFQRLAETVNIEVSNGRHSVHDLVVIIKQLQAIIAALGDELSPPEKTDQGSF